MKAAAQVNIDNPRGMTFQLLRYSMSRATRYIGGPLAERNGFISGEYQHIEFCPPAGGKSSAAIVGGDKMDLRITGTEVVVCGLETTNIPNGHAAIPLLLLPENVRQALTGLTGEGAAIGLSLKWFGIFAGSEKSDLRAINHSPVSNWASLLIDDKTRTALLRFEYVFRMGNFLYSASSVNNLNGGIAISADRTDYGIIAHVIPFSHVSGGCMLGQRKLVEDEITEQKKDGPEIVLSYSTVVDGEELMLPELEELPFSVILPKKVNPGSLPGLFFRGTSLLGDVRGTGAILDLRPEVNQAIVRQE